MKEKLTTKIAVDITNEMITEAAQNEIKNLKKQIRALQRDNAQFKRQIKRQQNEVDEARRIVSKACEIADEFRENW